MNWLPFVVAFIGGIAVGAFYFGGLWWTASQVPLMRRPELWLVASFFVRIVVLLSVLYLVISGGWERLVIYMVGVLVARTVLIHWARNTIST